MELPAYTFCHPPEQPRRKSQSLNFSEDGFPEVRQLGRKKEFPVNDTQENYDNAGACHACVTQSSGPQPVWLKYDRQVLRFYAWFKEQVDERVEENHRHRRCTIYFYLSDGNIHISEPKERNSGLMQGMFLKKQKVPNGMGGWIEVPDFHLGKDICIFGHTYHIVGCDTFTKRYLMKHRLPVGEEELWPGEPLEEYRQHTRHVFTKKVKEYALRQFLDHDGKVLRFFCVWDDRQVPYGERRPYVLNYFLGDDTIEILEITERNNGRMPWPKLIRRQKLPKLTPHQLLSSKNIAGISTAKPKENYYRDTDLHIGSYIRIFDRDMLIHDVDEFTRNYYQKKYGYTEDMLEAVNVQEEGPILARMPMPEHNGFGSEADSYMNCISLIPKAPLKDFYKFIFKDGKNMCFSCKLVEDATHKLSIVDKTRDMIFVYYMSDDTVSVFEPPARNSGISSGRYLNRMEAPRLPGTKRPYRPSDCYMGQQLHLHERIFELIQADEWTLKYMEADPKQFPLANFNYVSSKIKGEIAKLPIEKKMELKEKIPPLDPLPKTPPKNPCSPPPPVSPCGEKCKDFTSPQTPPMGPCEKKDKDPISPQKWPTSPPKSLSTSPKGKMEPLQTILARCGIIVTKQEIHTLERYSMRNKDNFPDAYSVVRSFF
ncbi:unnamed protein product [Sphagnum compactum]